MCGICFISTIKLNENDFATINKINKFNNSFIDKEDDKQKIQNNQDLSSNNQMIIQEKEITSNLNSLLKSSTDELINLIKNRGPDYFNIIELNSSNEISSFYENFAKLNSYENLFNHLRENSSSILMSSVLSLRGINNLIKQPIVNDDTKNILQYNGEIFSFQNKYKKIINSDDTYNLYEQNDGIILSNLLNEISTNYHKSLDQEKSNFHDEFTANKSYADLMFNLLNDIDSDHAFVYNDNINNKILISRDLFGKRSLIMLFIKEINIFIVTSTLTESLAELAESNPEFIEVIEIPANSLIVLDKSIKDESTKLFFYNNELIKQPSMLRFKYENESLKINDFDFIIKNCFNLLKASVEKRICNLPEIVKRNKTKITSVAVLFSGGIDSLLLAYFTALCIPEEMNSFISIDLINLSFDKERAPDRNSGLIAYYELKRLVPNKLINFIVVDKDYNKDVEVIKNKIKSMIFPRNTHMDFNIATALKLATQLEGHKIKDDLFIPFMHDYIKSSLEALSNSKEINNYSNNILSNKLEKIKYASFIDVDNGLYKSDSKIVLSGLGADEFFGGYSRYNSSFKLGGEDKLKEEMSKDINRIWIRNFGRDDRVCSDNGIELRFPFFDFDLIDFLSNVENLKHVTNFDLTRGQGEKYLLRELCRTVGFVISNSFEKRAIQFGTKLAKETNLKKYGSNRKANGKAQYK